MLRAPPTGVGSPAFKDTKFHVPSILMLQTATLCLEKSLLF